MASYYKSIRVLLQPRLYEKAIDPRCLELCAEACRNLCETYKRLHYRISLQTVFLAGLSPLSLRYRGTTHQVSGLTLVYCMWHDSSNTNGFKSIGALTDCSIILYVMTEKWPGGKKYRDLFESVKTSVLDAIAEGKHIPRTAVTSMKVDMQISLQKLQVDTLIESVPDDLEQMISDMTGESISFWDESDMNMGLDDGVDFSGNLDGSGMPSNVTTEWDAVDQNLWFDRGYTPQFYDGVVS